MAQTAVIKTLALTNEWAALFSERTILTAALACPPSNPNAIEVRFNGAASAEWYPGTSQTLRGCDLSQIEVRDPQNANCVLQIIAQSEPPQGARI